jgi:hypothetical protein
MSFRRFSSLAVRKLRAHCAALQRYLLMLAGGFADAFTSVLIRQVRMPKLCAVWELLGNVGLSGISVRALKSFRVLRWGSCQHTVRSCGKPY